MLLIPLPLIDIYILDEVRKIVWIYYVSVVLFEIFRYKMYMYNKTVSSLNETLREIPTFTRIYF